MSTRVSLAELSSVLYPEKKRIDEEQPKESDSISVVMKEGYEETNQRRLPLLLLLIGLVFQNRKKKRRIDWRRHLYRRVPSYRITALSFYLFQHSGCSIYMYHSCYLR